MIKKHGVYDPVKEQLQVLAEYIALLEEHPFPNIYRDMNAVIGMLKTLTRQCEIFLNYEMIKQGKKRDRDTELRTSSKE